MSIFWELHQQSRIREANSEANRAYSKARNATMETLTIKARLDKALIICEALWSFLHEKFGITEKELCDRIRDIDLSDGALDGKVRRPPRTCPDCERVTSRRHPECLYCGAAIDEDPFAL